MADLRASSHAEALAATLGVDASAPTMNADVFAETVLRAVDGPAREGGGNVALPTGGGRFHEVAILGEGGMGRVFVAEDRQFGRTVAMKELLPGVGSRGLKDRFAVEAVVTGNLEHPGVPSVYERGVRADGAPFYAMRLVRGDTLSARVHAAKTMRERLTLLPAIGRLAHTLAFAHEHGVVHRDVKPDNVVLGKHGETVLLDWGIAKVRGDIGRRVQAVDAALEGEAAPRGATAAGSLLGTPEYMAPEQAAARIDEIDERTDVFAVGAVLYHLLAGKPPYSGGSTMAIVSQAIRAEPAPLRADVPPALAKIVAQAMAKQPSDRYQTATELAEALESFTTEAVAAKGSRAVRVFGDVASWVGFTLMALLAFVAIRMALPALRESPTFVTISMLLAALGCLLSFFEAWTGGQAALAKLSLAFAGTTLLMGLAGTSLGLSHTFEAAMSVDPSDVDRQKIVLNGASEALVVTILASTLTALQLVMWAMARRRVELSSRA
jgi:tRNA A-37 threonylcarbamoyl transferase component Bud32